MITSGLPDVVASCDAALGGALREPDLETLGDADKLALYARLQSLAARVAAAQALVLTDLDTHHVTRRHRGIDTAAWLRQSRALPPRQAYAVLRRAHELTGHRPVWDALAAGSLHPAQADAITGALRHLPDDLAPGHRAAAETAMIAYAAEFDPRELARLGNHLTEVVDPDRADDLLSAQLERAEQRARDTRELWLVPDGSATMAIRGRLPLADGEHLAALIDAVAEHRRARTCTCAVAAAETDENPPPPSSAGRAAGRRGGIDPGCPRHGTAAPSARSAARADALLEIVQAFRDAGQAPPIGADRPRLTVTVPLAMLQTGLGALTDDAGQHSAQELRRIACDADVIPAVLGAAGVPLDVGRERRLFPGGLRAALVVRDGGCAFPGCDRPPRLCEAHHIIPWWRGGPTSLDNGVLLCRHHHALVEPGHARSDATRWEARTNPRDRLPEFLPPRRLDPRRRPRRHLRHRLRTGPRRGSPGDDPG